MMLPPAYRPHAALAAMARLRPEGWRLPLGIAVFLVGSFALMQVYWAGVSTLSGAISPEVRADAETGATPRGMILMLLAFGTLAGGLALSLDAVHGRTLRSLIGPLPLAWQQFRAVGIAVVLLQVALAVLPPWGGVDLVPNVPLGRWLLILPLGLVGVAVQTATEELVFRGYLQQHLAARALSPFVWIGIPTGLFALGHYSPDDAGPNAMAIAVWAGFFGLCMADLTARAGTLGPAIALHLVHNAMAVLVVGYPGDLSGLALFVLPEGLSNVQAVRDALPLEFLVLLAGWLAARVAIRR